MVEVMDLQSEEWWYLLSRRLTQARKPLQVSFLPHCQFSMVHVSLYPSYSTHQREKVIEADDWLTASLAIETQGILNHCFNFTWLIEELLHSINSGSHIAGMMEITMLLKLQRRVLTL